MAQRRKTLVVGGATTIGLALLLVALYASGALSALLEARAKVQIEFADVQGLEEGDPVFLFGLEVGEVASVTLLPREADEAARLRVEAALPERIWSYLRTDTDAVIERTTADSVRLLLREGVGPELPRAGVIRGRSRADFAAVAERMEKVLSEAEPVATAIANVVTEIETTADLGLAFARLAAFPEELRRDLEPVKTQVEELIRLLRDTLEENRLDLRHAVADLKETTSRARSITDKLLLTPEKIVQTLDDLKKVAGQTAGLIRDNRPRVKTIVEDLRETASNATQLTAEVRRRPWLLLYRPSAEELKATELYDAAWAYNLGASELHRSLEDLTIQLDRAAPEGPELSEDVQKELELAYERVRRSLDRQREAEEEFWRRLHAEP